MNLIYTFGTKEQKGRWLIPLATGEKIGAFGLTEAQAGSDVNAIQSRDVLDGNEWIINGTKLFITNAGLIIVWLSVLPSPGNEEEPKNESPTSSSQPV
jgi:alkylation response protein AidB-like acyl-CoA dehydrogenase